MAVQLKSNGALPAALVGRFALVAAGYTAGALLFGLFLNIPDAIKVRWGVGAAAALVFQLIILWRDLPATHRPGEAVILPKLGPGNWLTLARGLLLGLLAGFVTMPPQQGGVSWLPVLLYTAADLLDFFDGLAARLSGHVTALGEKLDIELDGLGIGLAVLLVILAGKIGWWFLLVALARYWFVAGLWWRRKNNRPVYDLTASRYRRLIAGYNMGFLSVALWPIMNRAAVTVGAAVFVPPLLLIFARDWLVASGRLDPSRPTYLAWRGAIERLGAGWLPVVARLVIAVTAVTTGSWPLWGPINTGWAEVLLEWGWPPSAAPTAALVLAIIAGLTLVPVVLGIWARWLALIGLLPVAVEVIHGGLAWSNWDGVLLGLATCTVVILNSGRLSLVPPDEDYMFRHLGGKENGTLSQ